jgi:DNA repair protein RecN (Recombination protein N)
MLQSLRIRNLALLEEVSLEFEAGFTAVTGETGAGKSILLGALSLLAGERADKSLIRQGAEACEVEAALWLADATRVNEVLEEAGLPLCEEGTLVLRRMLPRDKAPRITVNGALTTLAVLQRVGELWIDFHGPSEPRRLLREACQLELVDLYGRHGEALGDYQAAYRQWLDQRAERERIAGETRLSAEQIAFLQDQLTRLEALELTPEAIDQLEAEFQRVTHAQELLELSSGLEQGLTDEDGVTPRLARLLREARRLAELDASAQGLTERLDALGIELADLAAEFGAMAGRLNFEPEEVAQVQARMDTWLDLKRRHGRDLAAVTAARDEMRQRLELQGDIEGTLHKLDRALVAQEKTVRTAAAALTQSRRRAAGKLAGIAAKSIARLGFKKAEFQIEVETLAEPGPSGDSRVSFLFSPNVGEAPLPLNRIASSGELARVMLALKTVLADLDAVPVLVFDEVDANVGGEIGRVVGEQMAAIGRGHQVICVTHLPQVAAQAKAHLVVDKDQSSRRAVVTIAPLGEDREARVDELARMLGDRQAASARAHAVELLGGG